MKNKKMQNRILIGCIVGILYIIAIILIDKLYLR